MQRKLFPTILKAEFLTMDPIFKRDKSMDLIHIK